MPSCNTSESREEHQSPIWRLGDQKTAPLEPQHQTHSQTTSPFFERAFFPSLHNTMTFTRVLLLSALFCTSTALALGISVEPAFLATPSLKFVRKLQLSRPSHTLTLRTPTHRNVAAQMPSKGEDERSVPVPAQAQAKAAVAVQDHPDSSSVFAIGLFAGAYIIFNGAVIFTVASVGHMLHAMTMQPDLPAEKAVFAACILPQVIGLCYVSTALADLIEVTVGMKAPEPEFLDAGAGI